MKALIVGINSFVGPFLAAHLQQNGYKVSGTTNQSEPNRAQLPFADFYKCDISLYDQIEYVLDKVRPDCVFNLAGFTSPFLSWQHPQKAFQSNTIGTVNLITSVNRVCPECRMVLVSTGNLYDLENNQTVTELSPVRATNPYAVSKLAAEKYARLMLKKGADIVIARPFNHTGPGQKTDFAVPCFAKQIHDVTKGLAQNIKTGNLESYRDFLDVRDVARAYRLCAQKGKSGHVYNIASGSTVQMKEILGQLIKLSNHPITVQTDPGKFSNDPPVCFTVDTSAIKNDTGWEPSINLGKTLADLLEWFESGTRKLCMP